MKLNFVTVRLINVTHQARESVQVIVLEFFLNRYVFYFILIFFFIFFVFQVLKLNHLVVKLSRRKINYEILSFLFLFVQITVGKRRILQEQLSNVFKSL